MIRRPDIAPLVDFMRARTGSRAPQTVVGRSLAPRLPDATPLAALAMAQRASATPARGAAGYPSTQPSDRATPRVTSPNQFVSDLAEALGLDVQPVP